jgi:hypothetical protein
MKRSEAKKVFISYCQENDEHKSQVRKLSNSLRKYGIEAQIDQYDSIGPKQGWIGWINEQLSVADFIIIVFSANYGKRKGSKYEERIVNAEIYNTECVNERVIPVVLNSEDLQYVPVFLKQWSYFIIHQGSDDFKLLYRKITGQPEYTVPPIGSVVKLNSIDPIDDDHYNLSESNMTSQQKKSQIAKVVQVEITIDMDLETFSQSDFLAMVNKLLCVKGLVNIRKIEKGSTIVTLDVPHEFIEKLMFFIKSGDLYPYNIVDVGISEYKENIDPLIILASGVDAWNAFKSSSRLRRISLVSADLHDMDLQGVDFKWVNLDNANLRGAKLSGANFNGSSLRNSDLSGALLFDSNLTYVDLSGSCLNGAELNGANLKAANLSHASLVNTNLSEANLMNCNLEDADLTNANLTSGILIGTNISNAKLNNCQVYGISAWDIRSEGSSQTNLIISMVDQPIITVDNIESAHFTYLILNNQKLRDVIDTIAKKSVLILGRFTPERKKILDAIRDKLREHDFVPIMFDFEKADSRDFTETIKILASMSRFVIADITNPKNSQLELQALVPDYKIPFLTIIQKGEEPFSMFSDLQKYPWVLDTMEYGSETELLEGFEQGILNRALAENESLMQEKQMPPREIVAIKDFKAEKR